MDTSQVLVALLGGGGGVTLVVAIFTGITKWVSGASAREREKNTNLIRQRLKAVEDRDIANDERDEADRKRRNAEENAFRYRNQLVANGIQPGEWVHDQTLPKNTPSPLYKGETK